MSDTIAIPDYGHELGPGFYTTTGVPNKTDVSHAGKVHPDYTEALKRWTLCRDVIAGEDVVRSKGTAYLPKPNGQTTQEYTDYAIRASFTNATGRAQEGLEGLIFRKKPAAVLSPELETLTNDITTTDMSLDDLAKFATHEVLITARGGLLVEYPVVMPIEGKSVADAEENGERPYITFYAAEDILNWREGRRKNKKQLTWIKLREWVEIGEGDNTKYVEMIREISLNEAGECVQFLYEGGKRPDVTPTQLPVIINGKPIQYVPFVPLGAVTATMPIQKPPVYDIAVKNIHHWQLSADRRNALHWADSPTPVIIGSMLSADGKPVEVVKLGSSTVLNIALGGEAKYLEFMGNGLKPTKEQMDEDMAEMAILLSRILAGDSKAAEAAETAAIHRAGENAVLASIANAISSAFTKALKMLAEFAGLPNEKISYRLNTNFYPTPMSSQMFIAMTNAVIAGTFSPEEFFEACVAGEVIRPDKVYDEHKQEIESMPKTDTGVVAGGAINPPGGIPKEKSPPGSRAVTSS